MHKLLILMMLLPYLNFAAIQVVTEERSSFLRNEAKALLKVELCNTGTAKVSGLTVNWQGRKLNTFSELQPGKPAEIKLPVETRLLPGNYEYPLEISYNGKVESFLMKLQIAAQQHEIMPVVSWGYEGSYRRLQEIGFTHGHALDTRLSVIFQEGGNPGLKPEKIKMLDDMLVDGFRHVDYYVVPHMGFAKRKYPRFNRDGKADFTNMEASNPGAVEMCRKVAAAAATAFGDHPAFDALLINSEIRDYTHPSFGSCEPAAFRTYAGFDIPPEVNAKISVPWQRLKNFPFSRVISDEFPLLVYYRWFWKEGDGWNPLHSAINQEYQKRISRSFWTFFDPAIRVPPIWGSGGDVDYLNSWTYAYPDPVNAGVAISELQAMAASRNGQGVMSTTQIICYRSQTAPLGKEPPNLPAWFKEHPKASFITLPPDSMRIALWTQLSRHISGIMLHGYGSLVPNPEHPNYGTEKGYQCTNLQTREVVSSMIDEVIRPLGPMLKCIPERPAEVAVFESFASSIFAGRGSWGWQNNWIFDANLMLQWANLAPAVIYEESILRDGFGKIKVLMMPHCDVLTEPVFKAIQDFQAKGGIIIADEYLVPGILPDIQVKAYTRIGVADTDKKALQGMAAEIRKQLAPYFLPYADSSNADLVTRVRSFRNADYLFVINDKRTYGDYIGQYKLVMDKGVPNFGNVTVKRTTGAAYDLIARRPVPFQSRNGETSLEVDFIGSGGRLFLLLDQAIDRVNIKAPKTAVCGKPLEFAVDILDSTGSAINALIPLELTVLDADGKPTDDSRFAVAPDGTYSAVIIPPMNCRSGKWQIKVKELASGHTAEHTVLIEE